MKAIELGATLYVPAIKDNLLDTAYGANPSVRSIVICLEDAIREDQVEQAEARFAEALTQFAARETPVLVFARPRNIEMLVRLLRLPDIEAIQGFVLPKITTQNLPQWLSVLVHGKHAFMPTIEGEEAFDRTALSRLRDQLLPYADRVTAIRIGGNDILNILGVRRSNTRTAYDGPLGPVIRDIAGTFLPYGFSVAAPVFEHFSSTDLLRAEVEQDIEHGLLTKTAVHPLQMETIQSLYRPSGAEMAEARAILEKDAPAVFGAHGSMCEPATHSRWAGTIIQRAQIYGTATPVTEAQSRVA